MRNLIVPCAGGRMVANAPLYLQHHPKDGMLLCIKSIIDIYPEKYDRIIFSILLSDEEKYNASNTIKSEIEKLKLDLDVEIYFLDHQTNGPANTVYLTVKNMNVTGEIVVKDSTNYQKFNCDVSGNFVIGLDLTCYEGFIEKLRSKSFISLNEQGQVLDIIEKKFRSDIISTGMYGIKRCDDFIDAYERLCDKCYPIDKLYLSHIISYLIGYKSRVFHCSMITEFEDWGTVSAWARTQKKYATLFLNMDHLLKKEITENELNFLKKKSISGCKFILLSSNNNSNTKKNINRIKEENINCKHVITDCSASNVKLIIDDWIQMEDL